MAEQAAPDPRAEEVPTIYVKAHPDMGERVAFHDVDPRHPAPGGEVFIYGGQVRDPDTKEMVDQEPVAVAHTALVADAISGRRLVQVRSSRRNAAVVSDEEPAPSAAGNVAVTGEPTRPGAESAKTGKQG